MFMKIHGQDQAVYFVVPSDDWPTVVDARLSSPQCYSSSGADEERSDGTRGGDEDEQTSYVHEKL